ncbi:MAG: Molybdenum cofactor guanylyltransferase [Candidatus Heimdallarchaeota archaeon LC_2]|nr:MAG: Molybdenum cofactor guanylyltransferase [Candidatus Heimdallarchaeota archaeon LC_2]
MNLDQRKDNCLIILAGGESRRFNNRIKALEIYNRLSLLGNRIALANKIFSTIIVSVSSLEIKLQCEKQLKSEDIDISKVSFILDKEKAQGPMKALIYIFPLIKTKYCAVIGVDNLLIRNNDFQNLQEKLISTEASLISVLLNKTRVVASFFTFDVRKILDLFTINPFIKNFERITDLFRLVPIVGLLDVSGVGQYFNVNTPEDLYFIEIEKINNIESDNIITINSIYFLINKSSCESFIHELKCWSTPYKIEHIVNNILKDAKKELNEDFVNCNLNDYLDIEVMKEEDKD